LQTIQTRYVQLVEDSMLQSQELKVNNQLQTKTIRLYRKRWDLQTGQFLAGIYTGIASIDKEIHRRNRCNVRQSNNASKRHQNVHHCVHVRHQTYITTSSKQWTGHLE